MKRSPRRSAAQWAELVSEYQTGSENEREFCEQRGIKLVTLRKWRYHFTPAKPSNTPQLQSAFVKANVSPSRASQAAAVLCIGQDLRLECPASYDVSELAQLALAVHHGR